ncbi:MAG: ABC transporter permease [Treponema sp.]|nr:ABC transporter permease [Treponema sp.]
MKAERALFLIRFYRKFRRLFLGLPDRRRPGDSPDSAGGPPGARLPDSLAGALRSGAWGGFLSIPIIALLVLVVLVFLLSKTPGRTLGFFFFGPFRNLYNFGNMLNSAIPLIFGGLGVSIAMKGGHFNLGGEGQIYAGAFTATICALALAPLGIFGGVLSLLAGACLAGTAAGFSGLCKARWDTSELITSFLVSNILVLIVNYLVNGPFLDPETNLQSTKKIAASLRLPLILPPSNLSAALFAALAAVVLTQFFLKRTKPGYEIRMAGANETFARYGGINIRLNTVLAMFLSGGLYGLAGGLAVFGAYYGTVKEFSSGLGWNGLAAALVARFYPPAVIPAALFFSWIGQGARIAMQNSDLSFEVASIVQSLIFFLVTSLSVRNFFGKKIADREEKK